MESEASNEGQSRRARARRSRQGRIPIISSIENNESEHSGEEVEEDSSIFLRRFGRLAFLPTSEREALLNDLRLISAIRHRRRMLEVDYSDDEKINDNTDQDMAAFKTDFDTDFRTYPINIDWYNIENDKKDYFSVLDKYGYFGVAVYSALEGFPNLEITVDKFLGVIIECFYKLFKNEKKSLINFMKLLPSPEIIKKIISNKKYEYKEITVLLTILKIYEIFFNKYEKPCYAQLAHLIIKSQNLLLNNISDELWKKIYDQIKGDEKLKKILDETKCKIFEKRKKFLQSLEKFNTQYNQLLTGLNKDKFII